jgi:hypothetical protein
MSSVRLNSDRRLQGAANSLGIATTADRFDLAFTYHSSENGCAAADLTRNGSRRIVGVLYEIPEQRVLRERSGGLQTLDDVEGKGVAYTRTRILVICTGIERNPVEAVTYLVKTPQSGLRTCAGYVHHILAGLREHRAPETYVIYVKERIVRNNPELASVIRDW